MGKHAFPPLPTRPRLVLAVYPALFFPFLLPINVYFPCSSSQIGSASDAGNASNDSPMTSEEGPMISEEGPKTSKEGPMTSEEGRRLTNSEKVGEGGLLRNVYNVGGKFYKSAVRDTTSFNRRMLRVSCVRHLAPTDRRINRLTTDQSIDGPANRRAD